MKRLLGIVAVGIMVIGSLGSVGAQETKEAKGEPVAVPTLISVNEMPFEVEQEGDDFTIILEENTTTGYAWYYTVNKEDLVEIVLDETVRPETELVGAPGARRISFKALANGVSTITFESKRNVEDELARSFNVLVYKTDDQLFVEEDQTVTIMTGVDEPTLYDTEEPTLYDTVEPTLYTIGESVKYGDQLVEADVKVQKVNGITMVPLRATLEAMGYNVTWNKETRSVEIQKGAQWTSVTVGKNAYFRNRMAAHELSSAPTIVDNRTLVPVEFFADIIGKGIEVDSGNITFRDFEGAIHTGYVVGIDYDETGDMKVTISSVEGSSDMMNHTIIHTSMAYTIFQKEAVEGEVITVVSPAVMTASIPGQTSGYVIY